MKKIIKRNPSVRKRCRRCDGNALVGYVGAGSSEAGGVDTRAGALPILPQEEVLTGTMGTILSKTAATHATKSDETLSNA
jgi:hypothetical protein